MLVLYETAMGFALFKLTDSAKLTDPNLHKEFETPERANDLCVQDFFKQIDESHLFTCAVYSLKLKSLHRFTSTATAVEEITAMQEGKLGKGLKEFLNKVVVEKGKNKEELVVVDPKLGAFPSLPRCIALHLSADTSHLQRAQSIKNWGSR